MIEVSNADALKKVCFSLKSDLKDYFIILTTSIDKKPYVAIIIDETLASAKGLDAQKIIKEQVSPLIKGGGGGQKTFATAGGQDVNHLDELISGVRALIKDL
jgi:alanyl-tRNA synthetase